MGGFFGIQNTLDSLYEMECVLGKQWLVHVRYKDNTDNAMQLCGFQALIKLMDSYMSYHNAPAPQSEWTAFSNMLHSVTCRVFRNIHNHRTL